MYDGPEAVERKSARHIIKIRSGELDFYWGCILKKKVRACTEMLNTSSIVRHVSPPLTLLLMNVLRASSTRSNAFAIHRKASLEASGSSLKADAKPSNVKRLVLDARYLDPEKSFPRIFTANKAKPASIAS